MSTDSSPQKGGSRSNAWGCLAAVLVISAILYFIANKHVPGGNPLNFLKPSVPVVVSFRNSLVGNGKVGIFSNQKSNRLTLTAEFYSRRLRETKTKIIDLEPNGREEIGWAEGVPLAAGDTITLSHPDYSSKTATVP